MEELNQEEFIRVLPSFERSKHQIPMMRSVIEGKQKGRILVDDKLKPETYVVITDFNWIYVVGNQESESFKKEFSDFIVKELAEKNDHFAWANLNDYWQGKLTELLGNKVRSFPRVIYKFNKDKYIKSNWRAELPSDYEIRIIDSNLINEACKFLDGIKMFWGTEENFLKNGIGFCLLYENKIISGCQSGVVTSGRCEIDVFTHQDFRKKKLSAIVCSAFIDHCLALGLEPYWECVRANVPSSKLAEKLGFEEVEEYPFYAYFKNA